MVYALMGGGGGVQDLCIKYLRKEEQKCNKMSIKTTSYLIPFKSYDDFSDS